MGVKERFEALIRKYGFENMRQFSIVLGVASPNIYANLRGEWNMSVKRMFKIAEVLECPIDEVLETLYPEEFEKVKKFQMK